MIYTHIYVFTFHIVEVKCLFLINVFQSIYTYITTSSSVCTYIVVCVHVCYTEEIRYFLLDL